MEMPLYWLLLVPAIAGLVAFLWPQRNSMLIRLLSLAVSIWLIYITAQALISDSPPAWTWTWLEMGDMNISLDLLVTPFGAIIALLIAIFGALISLYNLSFADKQSCKHDAYILWSLAGAIGAVLANNLIALLICWEIVTLMLFLLINLGGEKAKTGAAKTFSILGLSDCALLLGIVILIVAGNTNSLAIDDLSVNTANNPLMIICFLLFLIAALAKAGAMPFHTWIPSAAEGAPTDVMAYLPAAVDKLLGIYLLARVCLEFFTIGYGLKLLLLIIGAVTIVGAVMMAMVQHDLKKLLSFHAISQVGYMVVGIGIGGPIGIAGAIFHMVNNAIYKCCLFLSAGSVEKQTGTTDLDKLGGLARYMPLSFIACVVAAVAISGVPPMNGFASKWLIYQACLDVTNTWTAFQWIGPIVLIAAIFGSALTLASFVKVIHSVFLGAPSKETVAKPPRENSIAMTFPMLLLAAACLVFGIFATIPLERIVGPAMETMEQPGITALVADGQLNAFSTLWKPVTATILMIVALVFGLLIFLVGKGLKFREDRIYLGGEKINPEKFHYSGTGFYDSVRQLPGFKGAFSDAEKKVFDVYTIFGSLGGVFVDGLRRCQTGVLSLYVSWVVLGLVIIIIYLLRLGTG